MDDEIKKHLTKLVTVNPSLTPENDPKGLNANWIKNVSMHHTENMSNANK